MDDATSIEPGSAGTTGRAATTTYWLIAGISLLWNAFGSYDYLMTRMRNLEYLGQMGDAQAILAWIDGFPVWAQFAWPIGVWASLAGSVLLLLRSRHAVTAFLISLVGAVLSFAAQFETPMPQPLDSLANRLMPPLIVAVIVLLWLFSRWARERGILR